LQISFLVCFLVFVFFPVQGPRYLGVPQGVPDGPVRRLVLSVLEVGSSRGAAFPSSHVAVATTQFVMVLQYQRRLGLLVLGISLGLAAGAVYGGFHYAVDVLAGVAVGTLAVPLAGVLRCRLEPSASGFTSPPGAS
jgi:membrane-associated phospholipid phosphatase